MNIYEYDNYRRFLSAYIGSLPKKGHGTLSLWAKKLGVSTTLISQILAHKKSLSLEMAETLARHLNLTNKETDYFILMVEYDRAGTKNLKEYFYQKLSEAQRNSSFLKNRIQNVTELSSEAKAVFYSNWAYSGITNLVACKDVSTIEDLVSALKIPRQAVIQVIEFLVRHNLIIGRKKGWDVGPQSTYITSDSPLAQKHHQNWRLRAIHTMDECRTEDLFYTSPMSLSLELAKKLRSQLVQFIEETQRQVAPSPSEVVRCLNIDLFKY